MNNNTPTDGAMEMHEEKKRGRKPLPEGETRVHRIQIRVNSEELDAIREEAERRHVSMAVLLRMAAFKSLLSPTDR